MAVIDNVVQDDPIVQIVGLIQPSLYYTVTFGGETVDMTGATVSFFMRPLLSRAPVVNEAGVAIAPADDNGRNVRYDWQISDVAIKGRYSGWWGYTQPGSSMIETPEFPIVITDQGPGFGTSTGVIVDGIAQWLPTTLGFLRRVPNFGDRFLQHHADYVKRIVMGTVVTADAEASYDPALIDYLSKRTTIRLIPAAKDFWGRQYRQVMAQGPSEQGSYPDMLANLDALERRLCAELPTDWLQLQQLVPGLPQLRVSPAPVSSLGDGSSIFDGPVTPNPQYNQRPRLGGPRWSGWFQ